MTTLSAHQSTLDEIATKADSILQSLQQSGTMKQNDQKEFLELQYLAEKICLCEDKIKLLHLEHIDINYTLNTNIQPLILSKNKLGKLSLQTATFQYSTELHAIHYPYTKRHQESHKIVPGSGAIGGHVAQSVKLILLARINVKVTDDKRDCLISGIDITIDGNMLLADKSNCKVKLFSPDGILLSSLKAPEKPKDVAVIKKSEAAVSMNNKKIGIIGLADSGHLHPKCIITTEQYVRGITAYNNNLIGICETSAAKGLHSVQMIDMTGKVLWTATTDSEGKNLFDFAELLTTCSGDDGDRVLVTDSVKHIITVLYTGTGKVVKVCDVKGEEPWGVTVDDNGNVYICYKSGDITVWSRGMQKETCLTTKIKDVKFPWAMACNSRRSELVLTSAAKDTDYCNFIHRFKILVKFRSCGQNFFDKMGLLKKNMLA